MANTSKPLELATDPETLSRLIHVIPPFKERPFATRRDVCINYSEGLISKRKAKLHVIFLAFNIFSLFITNIRLFGEE